MLSVWSLVFDIDEENEIKRWLTQIANGQLRQSIVTTDKFAGEWSRSNDTVMCGWLKDPDVEIWFDSASQICTSKAVKTGPSVISYIDQPQTSTPNLGCSFPFLSWEIWQRMHCNFKYRNAQYQMLDSSFSSPVSFKIFSLSTFPSPVGAILAWMWS